MRDRDSESEKKVSPKLDGLPPPTPLKMKKNSHRQLGIIYKWYTALVATQPVHLNIPQTSQQTSLTIMLRFGLGSWTKQIRSA